MSPCFTSEDNMHRVGHVTYIYIFIVCCFCNLESGDEIQLLQKIGSEWKEDNGFHQLYNIKSRNSFDEVLADFSNHKSLSYLT